MKTIEVCVSPLLFNLFNNKDKAIVIVDIFRATSMICTLFMNGVSKVIPVESIEVAAKFKDKGFLIAAERNGKKIDFADFGNSPFEFTSENIIDKTIVYSTSNGTKAINMCKENESVVIASFLNISSVANFLIQLKKDIIIFCSGWEGDMCLEDIIFSGSLIEKLNKSADFIISNDAALSSFEHWDFAKSDLDKYFKKTFQYNRLKKLGMTDIIKYCLQIDKSNLIPVFKSGTIIIN